MLLLSGFGTLVVGGILTISFIAWSISATAGIITSATCFIFSLIFGGISYAITRARGKKEEVTEVRHFLGMSDDKLGKNSDGMIVSKVLVQSKSEKILKGYRSEFFENQV